jgi:RNA polymerase sigma-70 factor, ECF subfamily
LRESVELAFVVALQHLPPKQRAALILREVLGFSAQEVAETLETTVPSVKSALQRARRAIDERLPEQSQQAMLRPLSDEGVRELVQRYMDAFERDDIDAVVAMLTDDATIVMPPTPTWYSGREAIAAFYAGKALSGVQGWRHMPTRANGQPAVGCYSWDREKGSSPRTCSTSSPCAAIRSRRSHRSSPLSSSAASACRTSFAPSCQPGDRFGEKAQAIRFPAVDSHCW